MKVHILFATSQCTPVMLPTAQSSHNLVPFLWFHLLPSNTLSTLHHLLINLFTNLTSPVTSFLGPRHGGGTKRTETPSLLHRALNSLRDNIHCIYIDENYRDSNYKLCVHRGQITYSAWGTQGRLHWGGAFRFRF